MPATTTELAQSATAEGEDAVRSACGEAVDSLPGDASLVIAFISGELDQDRSAAALREAAPEAVTVGISGQGAFGPGKPIDHGCAAIAFDPSLRCSVGVGRNASADLRSAGRAAARPALEALVADDGDSLLLVLLDARSGDLAEAIAGVEEVSGPAIPMAGGAAGGPEPSQYANGEALTDAVVAVGIRSPRPMGVGNAQTSKVVGEPGIVTHSEGRQIFEIDGRPAEDVYVEQLGFDDVRMKDEEFEAMAMTHPLSQPQLHGGRRLRQVLGRAPEGGLLCAAPIPSAAAIEFTELSTEALIRSGWDSVTAALEPLEPGAARAALVFDSANRRRALGDAQGAEVDAIAESFGSETPPLGGIYTNGEIARARGAKGDHHHAVVTVAFA